LVMPLAGLLAVLCPFLVQGRPHHVAELLGLVALLFLVQMPVGLVEERPSIAVL